LCVVGGIVTIPTEEKRTIFIYSVWHIYFFIRVFGVCSF